MVVVTFACMRHALARRRGLTGFACETVASSNCCLLHSAGKAGRGRTEAAASKWPCVAPCSLQSHTGFQHALRGRAAGERGRMMSLELGRAPDPDRQPAPRRACLLLLHVLPVPRAMHGVRPLPWRRTVEYVRGKMKISSPGSTAVTKGPALQQAN